MPRIDRTRDHRLDQLAKDGSAIDQLATRLAGLLGYMNHAANDCADHATAARIREWAQGLADVTQNDLAAVIDAHERACDEERAEPMYRLPLDLAVTFGMAADLQRVPVEMTDSDHIPLAAE